SNDLFNILQSSSILPNSFNDLGLSSAELRNVRVQYAANLDTIEKKYNYWSKKNVSTKSSSEANHINRNRMRNILRQEHYKSEKIYKKCASSHEPYNILKI
ncbi:hypothetical protein BCV72DRAFT_225204, partial [Rhizopus microsporus var. microsporus]